VRTRLKLFTNCCVVHVFYITSNFIIRWLCYRKASGYLTRGLYHNFAHMPSNHNGTTYVDGCYTRTRNVTSPVTSIECVELYPVKLGLSDYCGIERRRGGGEGETQAPTEKDRRYLGVCDKRTQLLGIEENCFVSSVAAVCRRCENYFKIARYKGLDQYRIIATRRIHNETLCT